MIRTAAALVEEYDLDNDAVVAFVEIGSEGAVLRFGANVPGGVLAEWWIARDGAYRERT
jgi:hypothetical protein